MSERNRSNVILKAFRCFHLITPRDKKLLIGMASIQVFIGLLDLVGVAFLGVLGSLVINGVNNAPTNDLVIRILSILHIENLSFQNKAIFLAVFAVTVLLTRTLVSIMLTKSIYRILGRISARLTYQFSKNMLEHDLSKIETFRRQELIFSLTHGVQKITVEIIGQLVTMAADLASFVFLLTALLIVDTYGTLFICVLTIPVIVVSHVRKRGLAEDLGRQSGELTIKSNDFLSNVISAYREFHIRGLKNSIVRKLYDVRLQLGDINAKNSYLPYSTKYLSESLLIVTGVCLAAIQFIRFDASRAAVSLGIFLAAGGRLGPAVLRIQQALISIRANVTFVEPTLRLIEVFPSKATGEHLEEASSNPMISDFKGSVSFENVNYMARDSRKLILKNITVSIPAGSFVGIVGPSGSGKSTFLDLMMGINSPTTGKIEISRLTPGQVVQNFPGKIAYVPQSPAIISGSIFENISLQEDYSPEETERIQELIQICELNEIIDSKEGQRKLSEGGSNLSGGQRQRVGIARALFTMPEILVLDEATSALDAQLEDKIMKAIYSLNSKITLIVAAHRLSTIKEAECIYYFDSGEVSHSGTFSELRKVVPNFESQAKLMNL